MIFNEASEEQVIQREKYGFQLHLQDYNLTIPKWSNLSYSAEIFNALVSVLETWNARRSIFLIERQWYDEYPRTLSSRKTNIRVIIIDGGRRTWRSCYAERYTSLNGANSRRGKYESYILQKITSTWVSFCTVFIMK